jgi:hypothetical protein
MAQGAYDTVGDTTTRAINATQDTTRQVLCLPLSSLPAAACGWTADFAA